MDLVIKELLRLVAPVPLVMRKTVTETSIDGYYIPSGVLVAITPAVNHFAPTGWTEPDRFDPTRFEPPRREDEAHRFAWLPFGGGAHKCIGMHFGTLEVKAILHEMLREFTWSLEDGYPVRWIIRPCLSPPTACPLRCVADDVENRSRRHLKGKPSALHPQGRRRTSLCRQY